MTEINFYSKEQTDSKLDEKANSNDVYKKNETYTIEEINAKFEDVPDTSNFYTKTEVNDLVSPKANSEDVYSKSQNYTKTEVDNLVSPKADSNNVYTKSEVDSLVSPKANSSDVYTKSNTYSKTEVDNLVSPKANSSDVYPKSETYTKSEVNGLINAIPNFNGLTEVVQTPSISLYGGGDAVRITFSDCQDGDIFVISGRLSNYAGREFSATGVMDGHTNLFIITTDGGTIETSHWIRLTNSGTYKYIEVRYVDAGLNVTTITNYNIWSVKLYRKYTGI